jgi:hypothetical protein
MAPQVMASSELNARKGNKVLDDSALSIAINFLVDKSVWFWTAGAGVLGRLMYHSGQVQQGKRRRFFSRDLVMEMVIALGMGFMAHGLCQYLSVHGDIEVAVIILVSYLGPNGVNAIFDIWINKQKEKKGE